MAADLTAEELLQGFVAVLANLPAFGGRVSVGQAHPVDELPAVNITEEGSSPSPASDYMTGVMKARRHRFVFEIRAKGTGLEDALDDLCLQVEQNINSLFSAVSTVTVFQMSGTSFEFDEEDSRVGVARLAYTAILDPEAD